MDSLSTTVSFALEASTTLHRIIRDYQSQNKDARTLKAGLDKLNGVLVLLRETIASNPTLDIDDLQLPIQHCGDACEGYARAIAHSDGLRLNVHDCFNQQCLQGDTNDFKAMLAIYKSTFEIVLANANIRVAAISHGVLEDYKDMISDTRSDLDTHLEDVQGRIAQLQAGDVTTCDNIAMREEKESTQRSLEMSTELSTLIARFQSASIENARFKSASIENAQFSNSPSAHEYVESGLGEARLTVETLTTRLNTHMKQLVAKMSSETVAAQLARLRQTHESINHCIQIVSKANDTANERSNVFENITLEDNSYNFSVSTIGDLVHARRLKLSDRSRHFGGQVTDETVQRSITALTQLDIEYLKSQQHP